MIRSFDARRCDSESLRWLVGISAILLAYWGAYLKPITPGTLYDYWESSMLSADSLGGFAVSVARQTEAVLEALLPLPGGGGLGASILIAAALMLVWVRWRAAVVLVAPFAAAIAVSSFGLMPYGGGRTDAHLLAAAAGLLAFALNEIRTALGRSGLAVVTGFGLFVLIAAIVGYDQPWYNRHDIRPLVQTLEDRTAPGDAVIVYPSARYAFALYTSADIRIIADDSHPNGFTVDVLDPQVTVLTPSVDDASVHGPKVMSAVGASDTVWYIGTFFQDDDAAIASYIEQAGFVEKESMSRPGARLARYERQSEAVS